MRTEFQYGVVVTVKNDKLTGDAGLYELTTILMDRLAAALGDLPWVLDIDVKEQQNEG